MSILIAYIIIGLTFAASLTASHVPVSGDRWWHYWILLPIVILWPVTIYHATKTHYRYKYF